MIQWVRYHGEIGNAGPDSYLRLAVWLGRLGCGYGLALGLSGASAAHRRGHRFPFESGTGRRALMAHAWWETESVSETPALRHPSPPEADRLLGRSDPSRATTEGRGCSGPTSLCYAAFMTDRQSGWNCALNFVEDVFTEVAWQPGLQSYRREAALALTKVPETMMDTVGPFRKRLEGEPCPEPPFDSALSEDSLSDMDTAISI